MCLNYLSVKNSIAAQSAGYPLDWIRALQIGGITEDDMKHVLPYIGVLLKKTEDLQLAAKEHLY